jgi:hypothetical protein
MDRVPHLMTAEQIGSWQILRDGLWGNWKLGVPQTLRHRTRGFTS